MKIAIDNRAAPHSGMGNYSSILLELLPQIQQDIKVIPYEDKLVVNRQGFWNKYVNGLRRIVKDQYMYFWLREHGVDVFHNPRNKGIPIFHCCKMVTTIHDVIPHVYPQYYLHNALERILYELLIRISIHCSDAIITISKFSKQELMKYYHVPENKISVIPQACSDAFCILDNDTVGSVKRKYGLKRPYIMTIGGSEYRKNVKTVIQAYRGFLDNTYDLVIIGSTWHNVDLAKIYKDCPEIKFLRGISDEDLIALYNGAKTFVFASIYEGFGLPLLESMRCGTPVIAARASCLPEVAGDAAVYFAATSVNDLRNTLQKVLSDEFLQGVMVKKGIAQSQLYSWEKTASETYQVYEMVYNG
jgi:glycosyltransferase involved in cell wall biosynthesis